MSPRGSPRYEVLKEAERFCRSRIKAFRDDAEVLEAISLIVRVRTLASSAGGATSRACALDRRATAAFQKRFRSSGSALHTVSTCERLALEPIEVEILLILIAAELGMISVVHDIEDLQKAMACRGARALAVARALADGATLVVSETVRIDESPNLFCRASLSLSREILEPLLRQGPSQPGWEVASQEGLLQKAYPLFRELCERSEELNSEGVRHRFLGPKMDLNARDRKIEQLTRTMRRTLDGHPGWPASRINAGLLDAELQIAFVLIGKELGYLDSRHELFTGEGLARCVSVSVPHVSQSICYLRRDAALRSAGLVRVCGGPGDEEAHEDDSILMGCEFELTVDFREKLGITAARRQRRGGHQPRAASVKADALVLSDDVRRALDLIVIQARHGSLLFDRWGLRETVPYGRGMTVLFSGVPGVGKTACAESIAHRLAMPIITANYAELESMWVGETEKNIAGVFRDAAEAHAVLFWDECDAMFFDRGSAFRNWEVRQVSVLLREIERFEGVCILSTNRKVTLDAALERRIALKVEFKRPDRAMRAQIWRKQVPNALPLADDVDFDRLAISDMTGGEIKNAVLNAARIALARDPRGRVAMGDFEKAIEMERRGRWSAAGAVAIGFSQRSL